LIRSIWIIIIGILIASCSSQFSLQKRKYQKGFYVSQNRNHSVKPVKSVENATDLLPVKANRIRPEPNFDLTEQLPETNFQSINQIESSHLRARMFSQKNKQLNTAQTTTESFKSFSYNKLKSEFFKQPNNYILNANEDQKNENWKTVLRILAIVALVLLIVGVIYIGLILILLGGVLTGGAIFSEPRFIMFLALLALMVILSVLLIVFLIDK
jgi:ABC-type multidrug transport system fused ATPase/permease subunit